MNLTDIDIQTEKLDLINWISSLDNKDVIQQLKSIKQDNFSIPEWQKKELDKRWDNFLKNPDSALDGDTVLEEFDKDFS